MKKKRIMLFLIIFILNSIYVLADEEAYNKWNHNGDVFTAAEKTFTVHSLTEFQTKIESGGKFLNINNGTCDVSDFIKVCIGEIKKDANISLGYSSNIKIYKMTANLELTRTIDKTSFIIGEEANIEILIKNTGLRDAADINFEDRFSAQFEPKNAYGCLIKDHTVFFQGSLWQGNEKKCSYKIEALSQGQYESSAELTYNNGFQIKTLSDKKKITVEDYALRVKTSAERNDLGEEFNYNVKLENINKDYPVNIPYVEFTIPKEIEIVEKPINLWKKDNVITFAGEIEPNSVKEFNIRLKGEKAGTYTLKKKIRFLINRIVNEFEQEEDIIIEIREPSIMHNIKDSYLSNETINFILKLENPSARYSFNNPALKTFGLIESFYKTPKLLEEQKITAIDKTIVLPKVEKDTIIPFNITLEYETIYKQNLKTIISKNVLIKIPEIKENATEVDLTWVKEETTVEKEEETPKEELTKEKKEEKNEISLVEMPSWAIIFFIVFLLIDSFLVISIIKKMKKK